MYNGKQEVSKAFCAIIQNIAALIKVKSIVTLAFAFGLIMLLSGSWAPSDTVLALFSSSMGATLTYYFTRKEAKDPDGSEGDPEDLV